MFFLNTYASADAGTTLLARLMTVAKLWCETAWGLPAYQDY